jgi:hypothetical protein
MPDPLTSPEKNWLSRGRKMIQKWLETVQKWLETVQKWLKND